MFDQSHRADPLLNSEEESKGSAVIFKADSDLCESGSVLSLSLPLHTKELASLWPGEV